MAERKAFNFYKSYYDIYQKLNSDDKVAFMDALLNKQFNGIDPSNLPMMADFAYTSQKQVINQQVKGWEDKTHCKLNSSDPTLGGCDGGTADPSVQEKEEGEEQGKGKEEEQQAQIYDYAIEIEILNSVRLLFENKYYDTKPKRNKWLEEIRKLIDIDKYDKKEIIDTITFGREDDFWKTNFMSIGGIRKKTNQVSKFDKIKAKKDGQNGGNQINNRDSKKDSKNTEPDYSTTFR